MFGILKKKRDAAKKVEAFNQGLSELKISKSLEENAETMKQLFQDVDIMKYRYVSKDGERCYFIAFSDGMVNSSLLNDNILRPLTVSQRMPKGEDCVKRLTLEVVQVNECQLVGDFSKIS